MEKGRLLSYRPVLNPFHIIPFFSNVHSPLHLPEPLPCLRLFHLSPSLKLHCIFPSFLLVSHSLSSFSLHASNLIILLFSHFSFHPTSLVHACILIGPLFFLLPSSQLSSLTVLSPLLLRPYPSAPPSLLSARAYTRESSEHTRPVWRGSST